MTSKSKIDQQGRECTKCGEYKLWSEFHKRKGRFINGRSPSCRECINESMRDYRSSPEYENKYEKFKSLKKRINPETGKPYKRGEIFDGKIIFKYVSRKKIKQDYDSEYLPFESYEFNEFILPYIKQVVSARNGMIKRGLIDSHNLTVEHLLDIFPMDMICPIYGIEMTFVASKDNSIELDKMDRDKGYVTGNVAWISAKANRAKSDSSKEELQKIVNFLESKGL